jgi:hypothetical protein
MTSRVTLVLGMLCTALGLFGGDAEAQRPLRVDAEQGLAFGDVIPGVPHVVSRTDPIGAARIEIRGANRSDIVLSFLLPLQLTGPGGAGLPLTFGAGAAGFSQSGNINAQVSFDPHSSVVFSLANNGKGTVYLGGTLLPPAQAPTGPYQATITLTISYVGS